MSMSFSLLHPSCPPPSSFLLLGKISWGELKGLGSVSILFLRCCCLLISPARRPGLRGPPPRLPGPPPRLLFLTGPPGGHPFPGELLRMEVIYWWPLCLFSLPLLLVILSTLLRYLAAEGLPLCVCACVCVRMCLPPMSEPIGICDLFIINLSIDVSKMVIVGGIHVLLK